MKCPKCSYTSFDYLHTCRKCGSDLRDAKTLLQIIAVSPDERAAVFGEGSGSREAPRAGATFETPSSAYSADLAAEDEGLGAAPASDDAMLADLNFDRSFEDMVVPTSHSASGEKAAAGTMGEDDDLLDLDFGDVFGEKEKK